jgi:hypothetical protein
MGIIINFFLLTYFLNLDHNPATRELSPPSKSNGSGEAVWGRFPDEL